MSKVTSKLQVTIPKSLAARYDIEPGDDIDFEPAGDVIRVVPPRKAPALDVGARLKLFDDATSRQRVRERASGPVRGGARGWSREELYDRDRSR